MFEFDDGKGRYLLRMKLHEEGMEHICYYYRRLHLNLRNVGTKSLPEVPSITVYQVVPCTATLAFDHLVHDPPLLHVHFMHLSNIASCFVTLRVICT